MLACTRWKTLYRDCCKICLYRGLNWCPGVVELTAIFLWVGSVCAKAEAEDCHGM